MTLYGIYLTILELLSAYELFTPTRKQNEESDTEME